MSPTNITLRCLALALIPGLAEYNQIKFGVGSAGHNTLQGVKAPRNGLYVSIGLIAIGRIGRAITISHPVVFTAVAIAGGCFALLAAKRLYEVNKLVRFYIEQNQAQQP